jgi:hypothetical protein
MSVPHLDTSNRREAFDFRSFPRQALLIENRNADSFN